jgi:hypothetical protein
LQYRATAAGSRFAPISPADHAEVRVIDGGSFELLRVEELALDQAPDSEATGRGVLNTLRRSRSRRRQPRLSSQRTTRARRLQGRSESDVRLTVRAVTAQPRRRRRRRSRRGRSERPRAPSALVASPPATWCSYTEPTNTVRCSMPPRTAITHPGSDARRTGSCRPRAQRCSHRSCHARSKL